MADDATNLRKLIASLTADIVAAHVANNRVAVGKVGLLIQETQRALVLAMRYVQDVVAIDRPEPAAPVNSSVMPGHIVCLEDGGEFRMLKRHLLTAHGMTPEEYRERWNLEPDYPMVAPDHSRNRSDILEAKRRARSFPTLGERPPTVKENGGISEN